MGQAGLGLAKPLPAVYSFCFSGKLILAAATYFLFSSLPLCSATLAAGSG
jgi:hypothetical protein